jgi:catalase
MLQGRLFAYGDAHRYRLGINHTQLPVNRPHATEAHNYGRDGYMRFDDNGGGSKNYEPNSYGGPAQSNEPLDAPLEVHGLTGSHPWERHLEDDDFVQAGNLYRVMSAEAKNRLIDNIVGQLACVSRNDVVERSIGYFRKADADYGVRIETAVKALRLTKA